MVSKMAVPSFDLSTVRQRVEADVLARWQRILSNTSFVLGPEVTEFERDWSSYLGVGGCVGVGNGTDALGLALRALGLSSGDEVIVPAMSFFATAEAVLLAGGIPRFADIDPLTLNIDPASTAARITSRTVGIIGVHLYGRPFDIDRIREICARRGLWLLEDSAQAQGAMWRGRKVGGLGDASAWSFYPSKNLGCFGDGGAVTSNSADLIDAVRQLANHGQSGRSSHAAVGMNSRLDSLQAAVLNSRLRFLDDENMNRAQIAIQYRSRLESLSDVEIPRDRDDALCVYHQFVVQSPRRDELAAFLQSRGIGSAIHYSQPLHTQPALGKFRIRAEECPVAERLAHQALSLPMFVGMTIQQADLVCDSIEAFPTANVAAKRAE